MKLTVVGCSGSGPGPEGPASCYLVEHDGFALVLDLGNGALGALSRYTDPGRVGAVLLSHLHSDHCLDTTAMLVLHRYRPGARPAPIPLYGPEGTTQRLLAAADPGTRAVDDVFAVQRIDELGQIGPFGVRTTRTAHPVPTFAVRLDVDGASLTYSADTGECPALVELARGSDVLLCEAAFREPREGEPANPAGVHLTGRGAAEHAARAGVGQLLLTHVPLWYDPADILAEARPLRPDAVLVTPGSIHHIGARTG